jgi:3-dehydroquinate dehydratase-2
MAPHVMVLHGPNLNLLGTREPGIYGATTLADIDRLLGDRARARGALPAVEVHLSNVHAREPYRQQSFVAPVCVGTIGGFGARGYTLALDAVLDLLEEEKKKS